MCIRDSHRAARVGSRAGLRAGEPPVRGLHVVADARRWAASVSYTHLRAHETVLDLVCRLLLEKKKREHPHCDGPATHKSIAAETAHKQHDTTAT